MVTTLDSESAPVRSFHHLHNELVNTSLENMLVFVLHMEFEYIVV